LQENITNCTLRSFFLICSSSTKGEVFFPHHLFSWGGQVLFCLTAILWCKFPEWFLIKEGNIFQTACTTSKLRAQPSKYDLLQQVLNL
jgi:hypothetical protein